jgi:hypothetical protein
MAGLVAGGLQSLTGLYDLPLFIALKLFLLAFAISCGLMIRRALKPFGPAFAKLSVGQESDEVNIVIAGTLAHAKRYVIAIWAALLTAAALGVWTPTSF